MFRQGGFVVNISGRPWHAVALDESHEMLINKHCKTSITRPLPDYNSRIAKYMPYRVNAMENLKEKILSKANTETEIRSKTTNNPNALTVLSKSVFNDITNSHCADPKQKKETANFSEKKVVTTTITQLEKDKRLILSALKTSYKTGAPVSNPSVQLLCLPLALCDQSGSATKGVKSNSTQFFQSRYKEACSPVIILNAPWHPRCSVIVFTKHSTYGLSHNTQGLWTVFNVEVFGVAIFQRV